MKKKSLLLVAALFLAFALAFAVPGFAHAASPHVKPLACGSGNQVASFSYTSSGTTYDAALEYDATCDKYFAIGLRSTTGSFYLEVDDAYNPYSVVNKSSVAAYTFVSTGEIPDSETIDYCVGPSSSSHECRTV